MIIDSISVNAHSSIRAAGEKVCYFDPFHIKDEPHDADVIFITHDHYDHLSPEDIAKVRKDDTVFVLPSSCKAAAEKAELTGAVYATPGEAFTVCGIPAEAVPAHNKLLPFHPKKNGWLGYVVTLNGERVYVAGDTDALSENEKIKCDVALVPVGGKFTMDVKHAAAFVSAMKPCCAVPTHYGDIVGDPGAGEAFASAVDGVKVVLKIK